MQKYKSFVLALIALFLSSAYLFSQTVTLIRPTNNEDCVPRNITFKWSAPNAISFHLRVATDINFNNLVVNAPSIPVDSFTTVLPEFDTQYYWRVTARYTGGDSVLSAVQVFRTIPAPPQPIEPPNGEICLPLLVRFNWSLVTGTVNYHLQISTVQNFATTVYDNNALDTNFVTVPLNIYYNTFYWRVRSIGIPCTTDWSPVFSLKTVPQPPQLVFPQNNAKGVPLSTELIWRTVSGAQSYNLQVADNQNFQNPIVDLQNINDTSYSINLANNKVYYWRVSSNFTDCTSPWSSTFNFRTVYPAVTLKSPSDGAQCVSLNPTFEWEQLQGVSSFRLQVSRSANFDTLIIIDVYPIFEISYDATINVALTELYWRVRAEDSTNFGVWSEPRMFTSTIFSPTLLHPSNNSTGNPIRITLRWEELYSGAVYSLKLSKNPDMSSPLVDINNYGGNTYQITLPSYNQTYYWQVRATYLGCTSAWSPIYVFKTMIDKPILVSPDSASKKQPVNPLYEWQPVVDALTYEIAVAKDANFEQVVAGQKGIVNTKILLPGDLETFTKYYWRVRASNLEATGEWSISWWFETGGYGPDIPELVSPADNQTKVPINPTLEWKEANRADSYIVQVSKDEFFTQDIIFSTETEETKVDLDGLDNYTIYYWRVAAINDNGQSRWSQVRRFRTIAKIPEQAPVLKTPVDNTENIDIRFTAVWNRVPFAQGYRIQVAKNIDFGESSVIIDSRPFDSTFRIDGLEYDMRYFWRVLGYSEAGDGPWSLPWTFKTRSTVSVKEIENIAEQIFIHPNPTSEIATLHLNLLLSTDVFVKIYDQLGRVVGSYNLHNSRLGSNFLKMDISHLSQGIYYCSIAIDGKTITLPFIIQK